MPSLKFIAALVIALFGASAAWADCTNPTGKESETVYNGDYHTWQFCNGTSWTAMGSVYTVPWVTSGMTVYYNGGNVGIGTATPIYSLEVKGGSIYDTRSDGSLTRFGLQNSNRHWSISNYGTQFSPNGAFVIADETAGAPRLTIDTSGNVGIGTSSQVKQGKLNISFSAFANQGIGLKDTGGNTAGNFIYFVNSSDVVVGSIMANGGSNVSYNTSSDRRLKENIVASNAGLAKLMRIHVDDFNFIADPSKTRVQGFIAQDLYKVYPEAVAVGGPNPHEKPWSVDYGRITPLLVKSLQELKADNDNLRSQVNALKADNDNIHHEIGELRAAVQGRGHAK